MKNGLVLDASGSYAVVATGSPNALTGEAHVWHLGTGRKLSKPLEHKGGGVLSAALHVEKDGNLLVLTASADDYARVWSMKGNEFELLGEPMKHTADVAHAAFSKDADYVVTGSYDQTAVVWRRTQGGPKRLVELHHPGPVKRVRFGSDARQVVTASADGNARVWQIRPNGGDTYDAELVATLVQGGAIDDVFFIDNDHFVVTVQKDSEQTGLIRLRKWRLSGAEAIADQRERIEILGARRLMLNSFRALDPEDVMRKWHDWTKNDKTRLTRAAP